MLMQLLADHPDTGRSLAEIARHLGVAKATCYPMVIALTEAGWLLRHPSHKTYRLGPAVIPIGAAAAASSATIDAARAEMHSLADASGLACVAFLRSGDDLVVGEVVQPDVGRRGTLGLRTGDTLELTPPLGASLAAWFTPDHLDEWFQRGAARFGTTADELRSAYQPILEVIRERGYSVECADQSEHPLSSLVDELRGRDTEHPLTVLAARQAQRQLSLDVLVGTVEPSVTYRPISINAVAFDADAQPAIALCLVDASDPMPGARTAEIGERVRDSAARVTRRLGGRAPKLD